MFFWLTKAWSLLTISSCPRSSWKVCGRYFSVQIVDVIPPSVVLGMCIKRL